MLLAVVILGILWFVVGITNLVVVIRLRPYRIDICPGDSFAAGRSQIWQWNVLNAENYTLAGRRLLRWLYAGITLQIGIGISVVWLMIQ